MAQEQAKKSKATPEVEQPEAEKPKNLTKKGEDLKKSMDDVLDEIDGILEENAEEFVAGYVQRGGE